MSLLLASTSAGASEQAHPLKPPDLSSPQATLKTFLASSDELDAYLARDYLPAPSREKFARAASMGNQWVLALDLSEVPPAARMKTGRTSAAALYEVLNRLPAATLEQAPDAAQIASRTGADAKRWVIPDTEIALVRVEGGVHSDEFLFSPDTVARAEDFYASIRRLPYVRSVPLTDVHDILVNGGGWMLPYSRTRALPAPLHALLAGQPVWKWIGLALVLCVYALVLWLAYRVSQLGRTQPLLQALALFVMPASLLAATPVAAYFALAQVYLTGSAASAVELTATTVIYLAGAWVSWRFASVAAEAIISSPKIAPESIDAHLVRLAARLLGVFGGAMFLAVGAERLGLPVYGIIAGLGVGGLAIALAAQPTIENLIGSINLFADKPIRVGDLCQYGDQMGTVEAIGIRSARIRGLDRTLTTIPNAALAKIPIVNLSLRDKMLVTQRIGLRYETTPEQLRNVLVQLREMLRDHQRIDHQTERTQFVGLGEASLDVELSAYVMTGDWAEFLAIREEILIRIMDIIEESGTSVAFPSRTVYLGRDKKPHHIAQPRGPTDFPSAGAS